MVTSTVRSKRRNLNRNIFKDLNQKTNSSSSLALTCKSLRKKNSISQENTPTWLCGNYSQKTTKSFCANSFPRPSLHSHAAVSLFPLVHYWTNGQHCWRSASHFSFLLYFPVLRSHRQFQPVHSCIPAHRNYFALLPAPCLGCMFKPPLFSCQHWKSQGHAGSKFNNLTKSFFCLFCYRQTKGRENAPLLSSSLKSGSN